MTLPLPLSGMAEVPGNERKVTSVNVKGKGKVKGERHWEYMSKQLGGYFP